MKVIKVKLFPSKTQALKLNQAFGACRWVYNFALEQKIKHYNTTQKTLSIFEISKQLPRLKKDKNTCWLKKAPSQALQQSLRNLESAFTNFFNKKANFPKFKSKRYKQCIHYPQGFSVSAKEKKIKLPKLGSISFKDKFDFKNIDGFKSITVSKDACGNYFASLLYNEPNKQNIHINAPNNSNTVGIDLGIETFATLSNGQKINSPKYLDKYYKKIIQQNKKLNQCKRGSKSQQKIETALAKTHQKISNIRKNFIHTVVNDLIENQDYEAFAIENLAIQDMQKQGNTKLSQLIQGAGWRMFRDILQYKARNAGKSVLIIGRWEASSKTCTCGHKKTDLTLQHRIWECDRCGEKHDRDILAANNIKKFSLVGQSSDLSI